MRWRKFLPAKTNCQMPTIIEDKLAFDFPPDWQVTKYDQQADSETNEPPGFDRRIMQSEGVKQVRSMDIVCRLPGEFPSLQFIEVKDDRKRVDEYLPAPCTWPDGDCQRQVKNSISRHTQLYETVLLKTVGTLAGLLLAERLGDVTLQSVACLARRPEVEIVLVLVELPPVIAPKNVKEKLRRLARLDLAEILHQKLSAKLHQWGLPFRLYNLTNRPPAPWRVRDLT